MEYSKLVYTERLRPDTFGKTLTIDFEIGEITVNSLAGGVKWCRLGPHERSTVEEKLNVSRPDEWAEDYLEPATDGVSWDLKLFRGRELVGSSGGRSGFPPREQWDAFRILADFCFAVTRRYGRYTPPQECAGPVRVCFC